MLNVEHLDRPYLPVILEWFVGFVETLVNDPVVGGNWNRLSVLVVAVASLTIPCCLPSLFMFLVSLEVESSSLLLLILKKRNW